MSALVDRITEVLQEHLHATNHEEWDGLRWHKCDCGAIGSGFVDNADHTAHVAERIAALFTEETQFVPVARDGSRWAARSREEAYSIPNEPAFNVSDSWIVDHIEAERRWVSEWAAEETP